LKTDHVDLLQLHSCGKDVLEKGEVIEALEKVKKAGKTRYIGYSGDSLAARYAVETGKFDTLMTSISIADQEAIDLTLPLAREKGMGVIVKRGIANAVWRYDSEPENGYIEEYWRRMQQLDFEFAKGERRTGTGPDSVTSIAMRFALSLPGVHTNVVGTTKPERFQENAKLLEAGPLDEATIAEIRKRWKEVAKPEWVGQI
jgi:aryl-alcohol dehydrogenase-like predicted oxidoreductase